MILINEYTKLSSHMSSMSINDRPLIKQIILIGSAKFLLQGVNVSHQLDYYTWAPNLASMAENSYKMERVQREAARYVLNACNYGFMSNATEMIKCLD